MKRFYILILMILSILPDCRLHAQDKTGIEYNSTEYNFGKISEKKGPVSATFTFTNNGKTPLVINQVIASCGCTTPEWTKSPVEPGKSGEIKVTFNPAGRPGTFVKTITVISNAEKNRTELRIRGDVETSEIILAVQYPVIMGNIRLNKRSIQIGEISSSAARNTQLEVINTSSKPVTLKFAGLPRHISAECSKAVIAPQETADIRISYNASAVKDWGARKDDFYILYGDETRLTSDRRVLVNAIIKEDFSKLTLSQLENAPKAALSEAKVDFGAVRQGQKLSKEIKIKNTGKSVLHIRKITSNNQAFKPSVNRMSIPAGSEAVLTIQLEGNSLKRPAAENLIILTNDPNNHSLPVRITANPDR
ncbi:MAG: DUF1573 domain-containing protein [Bacteroidales bacterium]